VSRRSGISEKKRGGRREERGGGGKWKRRATLTSSLRTCPKFSTQSALNNSKFSGLGILPNISSGTRNSKIKFQKFCKSPLGTNPSLNNLPKTKIQTKMQKLRNLIRIIKKKLPGYSAFLTKLDQDKLDIVLVPEN
jgi:hypothetical protein